MENGLVSYSMNQEETTTERYRVSLTLNVRVFVRPTQLIVISGKDSTMESTNSRNLGIEKSDSSANLPQHLLLKATKLSQKHDISSNSQKPSNATTVEQSLEKLQMNLSGQKPNKTTVSPSELYTDSKNSSFVEKGFLEILHPKFTPGPPMRSPTFVLVTEERRQIDAMKIQIHQMGEEMELMQKQRAEDKKKLQEFDKMRIQYEQLLEFKARIMESHVNLQREFQKSRQDTRDANEAKAKYLGEITELSENLEILTLDKEMAEEKCDTLQMELEISMERIEELSLDVEILRAENEGTLATDDLNKEQEKLTATELKKLQYHNHRLKEAVIRLRDIIAREKKDTQRASKELETKYSEIAELQKTKVKLSMRIDTMEIQIVDLQEQVDAALGAESMIETLTESKLDLEERVKLLEEEISELEALEEIHEQLIESNQDLESDLREEIETLTNLNINLQHEKDKALETIYDRDVTINKFRELVKTLTDEIQLKNSTLISGGTNSVSSFETSRSEVLSFDYNQLFADSKAYCQTIDVRINQIELQASKRHIQLILEFLPEEFIKRGGDYDAIIVLLLVERLILKLEIICEEVKEKFPSTTHFDKYAIFEGFSVHRYSFRSRCIYFICTLQMILRQIYYLLNHCEYNVLLNTSIYRSEIENHENQVNSIIEFLKKGQFDENSSIESIEHMTIYFYALQLTLSQLQDSNELLYGHKVHHDIIAIFDAGCDCMLTNAGMIQTLIQVGDETTESFWLMQFLMESANNLKQKLKLLRRKLPHQMQFEFIGTTSEHIKHFQTINESFGKLIKTLDRTAKNTIKTISTLRSDDSIDVSIEHNQLFKFLYNNYSKIYLHQDESLTKNFKLTICQVEEEINEIFNFIKQNENACISNTNTMCVRSTRNPIHVRAEKVRHQQEEVKRLSMDLMQREAEIKHLKMSSKKKLNEYSEMQIRKEMAEKNLAKANIDTMSLLEVLSQRLEKMADQVQSRESIIHNYIHRLNEKLCLLEKRYKDLKTLLAWNASSASLSAINSIQDLQYLIYAVKEERNKSFQIQTNDMKQSIKSMEKLFLPNKKKDKDLEHFHQQLRKVKNHWILSHLDLKKSVNIEKQSITMCSQLAANISEEYFKRNGHRSVRCDFSTFALPDVKCIFVLENKNKIKNEEN